MKHFWGPRHRMGLVWDLPSVSSEMPCARKVPLPRVEVGLGRTQGFPTFWKGCGPDRRVLGVSPDTVQAAFSTGLCRERVLVRHPKMLLKQPSAWIIETASCPVSHCHWASPIHQ